MQRGQRMKCASGGPSVRDPRRSGGFTLIEVMIVVAIIGIVTATAMPNVNRYWEAAEARGAAKSVADAFNVARAQAIRTGNNQVVFFSVGGAGDTDGNALLDTNGTAVPILVLDDGRPGSANQNCEIDSGESTLTFPTPNGVGWGFNAPTSAQTPPNELRSAIPASGSSFAQPDGSLATWVMFRPDGIPVAIDGSCNSGRLGTGGGTIYLWSTNRDFAVTLSPLGGVRVHIWNPGGGWSV